MNARPQLALTTSGKTFGLLGIFLFFAANNTGNNTLYLLATSVLSLLIISLTLAHRNLNGLEITWDAPPDCFAGQPASLTALVKESFNRPRFHLSLGKDFLFQLNPQEVFPLKIPVQASRRGLLHLSDVELWSLFPLGLSKTSLTLPGLDLEIYPTPVPVIAAGSEFGQTFSKDSQSEAAGDYWMHRPYLDGEDSRYIHWQASARSEGEFVVMKTIPRSEPLRVWVDFGSIDLVQIEEFLQKLTGFFLSSHLHDPAIWAWYQPDSELGQWISLKDPNGLKTWLSFFARFDAATPRKLLPPSQDSEVTTLTFHLLEPAP